MTTINSEVQKPDDATLILRRVLNATPERLVYTWDWEKDGSGTEFGEVEGKTSLITVEFLKLGERTEFVMTHTRFASVESRDNHAKGWGRAVDNFAKFMEDEIPHRKS